eukprot:TRINITY_DN4480_c1_g1_i2.p2 TRINITY_DN4480_c1_g1~~TRINITY_DN4480_c1_g1_i2.p2  ORF type:complete len:201 (-),score=12.55 TRINITY_DN4480_c1_g1_i2:610-1212(-)
MKRDLCVILFHKGGNQFIPSLVSQLFQEGGFAMFIHLNMHTAPSNKRYSVPFFLPRKGTIISYNPPRQTPRGEAPRGAQPRRAHNGASPRSFPPLPLPPFGGQPGRFQGNVMKTQRWLRHLCDFIILPRLGGCRSRSEDVDFEAEMQRLQRKESQIFKIEKQIPYFQKKKQNKKQQKYLISVQALKYPLFQRKNFKDEKS